MVWIHGGAFIEGNSEKQRFGPERLLNQDVVIVTCNYRIGIFGILLTKMWYKHKSDVLKKEVEY